MSRNSKIIMSFSIIDWSFGAHMEIALFPLITFPFVFSFFIFKIHVSTKTTIRSYNRRKTQATTLSYGLFVMFEECLAVLRLFKKRHRFKLIVSCFCFGRWFAGNIFIFKVFKNSQQFNEALHITLLA